MSLEERLEMVVAKLSSRDKLPVEGSGDRFQGGGWEGLKGQQQVCRGSGECASLHRLLRGAIRRSTGPTPCHYSWCLWNKEYSVPSSEESPVLTLGGGWLSLRCFLCAQDELLLVALAC